MGNESSLDSAIPPYRGEQVYIPDQDNAIFTEQIRPGAVTAVKLGYQIDFTGMTDEMTQSPLLFDGITLPASSNVLRGANVDPTRVSGWTAFSGNYDTGAVYTDFRQLTTDNDAQILGFGVFPTIQSGANPDRAQAFQGIIQVDAESTMSDRGGDAVAGFHVVWAKVNGLEGFTFEAGARVAPIWSDLQLYGVTTPTEEVANFLVTNGGGKARSVFELETTANIGWVSLFRFDQAIGTDPVAANTVYDTPESNTPSAYLTVTVNGTPYGIPLMAAS